MGRIVLRYIMLCCSLTHIVRLYRLVLYKERNMLLTEQQISRRRGLVFPQPERMTKVQKSMGAIRQVLGERKREKIAAHHSQKKALESMATVDNMELDSVSTSSSS